jgi:hypothetical protein
MIDRPNKFIVLVAPEKIQETHRNLTEQWKEIGW